MPRDYRVYFEDILGAIRKISQYTSGFTIEQLKTDSKTFDAVLRNLEIIGEAIKKIPPEFQKKQPTIEWKKISGLRDILIHHYFAVDVDIIWDVLQNKLPVLEQQIGEILDKEK